MFRDNDNDETSSFLLEFVQGAAGKEWAENRFGWNTRVHVCHWQGIGCDQRGLVVSINIAHSGLFATIAPSIANITTLRSIILANNTIHGTLPPEWGNLIMSNLTRVDLSNNQLSGPWPQATAAAATAAAEPANSLKYVDISNNQFTGSISSNLIGTRTTHFNLSQNKWSGTIPTSVGLASQLTLLDLSMNQLQGKIPPSLWSLPQLKTMHLHHNNLMGMLPSSFAAVGNMSLTTITLFTNFLSGTIPPAFSLLPELSTLLLHDNKLTGTVPKVLCEGNVNSQLEFDLDLGDYDEDADTDDDLGVLDISVPLMGSNDGDKNPANNGGKRRLESESCHRILCPAGYQSYKYGSREEEEEEEEEEGTFSCEKCSDDSFNPYLGARFCLTTDERTLLDFLHSQLDGPNWVGAAAKSWRDERVPTCEREGITCNDKGDVTRIDLRGMNLMGSLPEQIGYFRHLQHLDLSENGLSGTIPGSLHFSPLRTLNLSGNKLTGDVPPMLCKKRGVNGNGHNGIYTCNAIACAVGSFNTLGYANLRSTHDTCFACTHGGEAVDYLGSSDCLLRPLSKAGPESQTSSSVSTRKLSESSRVLLTSMAMFLFFGYCYFRARAVDAKVMAQKKNQSTKNKELHDYYKDEDEEEDYEMKKTTRTHTSSSSDGSTNSGASKGTLEENRFVLGISALAKQSCYKQQEQDDSSQSPEKGDLFAVSIDDEESVGYTYHVAVSASDDIESLSSGDSSPPDRGYRRFHGKPRTNDDSGSAAQDSELSDEEESSKSNQKGGVLGKRVTFWDTAPDSHQEKTAGASKEKDKEDEDEDEVHSVRSSRWMGIWEINLMK